MAKNKNQKSSCSGGSCSHTHQPSPRSSSGSHQAAPPEHQNGELKVKSEKEYNFQGEKLKIIEFENGIKIVKTETLVLPVSTGVVDGTVVSIDGTYCHMKGGALEVGREGPVIHGRFNEVWTDKKGRVTRTSRINSGGLRTTLHFNKNGEIEKEVQELPEGEITTHYLCGTGFTHRWDGPAVECSWDKSLSRWYVFDQEVSEQDHKDIFANV